MSGRARILIVGPDVDTPSEPGPGARANALAGALPDAHRVRERDLAAGVSKGDVVIAPPWTNIRALSRSSGRLVVDLAYARPFVSRPVGRGHMRAGRDAGVMAALALADHLITATESQRDLWIGAMVSARRLHERHYRDDPTLRSLIETVPTPPSGAAPTAGAIDQTASIVWNGPRHPWLDWETAAAAVGRIPGATFVGMETERWLDETDRAARVARAACVVRLHRDGPVVRYSGSQRLADCIAWGTPMVTTRGDETARQVASLGLGEVVPAGDVAAVAAAIEHVMRDRERYVAALAEARERRAEGTAALQSMLKTPPQPPLRTVRRVRPMRGFIRKGAR